MSPKIFMSFFRQSKGNKGVWGKHSRFFFHIVDFSGDQSVEGPNCSFFAASKGALYYPSRRIRVLSSETIGHFLKKIQIIYILFNHKFSSSTYKFSITNSVHDLTHYVITLERSHVVSSSSFTFDKKLHLIFSSNFKIVKHRYFTTFFCMFALQTLDRYFCLCPMWPFQPVHVICEVELVQDEQLWLKSIYIFIL